MCIVAHDVTERKQAEESLRHSLSVLLALREAGQVLGSTLFSEEIVSRLLEIMRGVSHLTAAVITMQNEAGELRIWRSAGLEGLRRRARFEREAEVARLRTLEAEEPRLFRLRGSGSEEDHLVGLCLPLRIKDRVIGVLEAYGKESLADGDNVEILSSLANQAASALEVEHLREDGYQVDYEEDLGDERLPGAVEIALFHVMQEALTNVRKHAQTRRVGIRLGRSGDEAHLEVRDYGRGFDPVLASAESGPGERVGLAGMRERVGMLGGELKIHSHPGVGTSIAATIPLTRSP